MKKKYWFFISAIVIIAAALAYNYVYQDHRDIKSEQPDFTITSTSIFEAFQANSTSAENTYLNKTIEISGIITEINNTDLTLDHNIFCQFTSNLTGEIHVGEYITLKGRCIGYDDLLEIVKLDQCNIK